MRGAGGSCTRRHSGSLSDYGEASLQALPFRKSWPGFCRGRKQQPENTHPKHRGIRNASVVWTCKQNLPTNTPRANPCLTNLPTLCNASVFRNTAENEVERSPVIGATSVRNWTRHFQSWYSDNTVRRWHKALSTVTKLLGRQEVNISLVVKHIMPAWFLQGATSLLLVGGAGGCHLHVPCRPGQTGMFELK